jgi:DNA mismatch endonuclease (patch repair protein)
MQRDAEQSRALEAAGWEVLRFWEHEPPGAVSEAVMAVLRARPPS